ncbi:hypothetical protein GUY44_12110 [Pimelobacter simplex]|uniref:Uncharacterized protein n=1 Tax=Nocardioides simplex TaxID=2045 RepID=A0A0A1DI01_NOCSI|nr:hypothetical protein [Pimelobacter simplex]AIY16163.1 hypothetical protein KR76_04225 [Pimelobacter simplex]MCG8151227.1 hypothetical protein [Pimelobacter simplex]GEB17178.1 hypothetical protein NSI01_54930 [Pimelobacter simplex]SFN19088.1 hypothetical protein SAMN05421671_0043 [Pimelobacter simplex]
MTADLDLIRRAANRAREVAEDAILASGDEPWAADGISWNDNRGTVYMVGAGPVNVCDAITEEQAEHIAHWDPATALVVAAFLEHDLARVSHSLIPDMPPHPCAVDIARAFLKEDADG